MSPFAPVLALLGAICTEAKPLSIPCDELAAVVFVESRGQAGIVRHETNGSCSVGLGGVNVPDCDPVAVAHLQQAQANLRASAVILRAGRRWCAEHPGHGVCRRSGAIGMYNPGDKAYRVKVRAAQRAIRSLMRASATRRPS